MQPRKEKDIKVSVTREITEDKNKITSDFITINREYTVINKTFINKQIDGKFVTVEDEYECPLKTSMRIETRIIEDLVKLLNKTLKETPNII